MTDTQDLKQEIKMLKRGKRTYFFDVKEAKNGNKFLIVTESRFIKEGEERKRNSFTFFRDDVEKFIEHLNQHKDLL